MQPPRHSWRAIFVVVALFLGFGPSAAQAASPAAISRAVGILDLFKRDPATGNLQWNEWATGKGWMGWQSLGGPFHPDTDIGVATRGPNHFSIYARGMNDRLYQRVWDGTQWSGWVDHGGQLTGGPSAVAWDANREDVFIRDTGGAVQHRAWDAWNGWYGWGSLGGYIAPGTGPAVGSRAPGYLDVAVVNGDGVWINRWRPETGWSDYRLLPGNGRFTGGPGVAQVPGEGPDGRQDYAGIATNGELHYNTLYNGAYQGWTFLGGYVPPDRAPAPIWWRDAPGNPLRYDIFTYGSDPNVLYQRTWVPYAGFLDWREVPGAPSPPPPLVPPGQSCRSTPMAAGSSLGISLGWKPSRITNPDTNNREQVVESRVYPQMVNCLRAITGAPPQIRIQFPIDGLRSGPDRGSFDNQLSSLRQLLDAGNVGQPVISIMSHDFKECAYGDAQPVASLAAGQALQSCQYPEPALYRQLFTEIKARAEQVLGRNDVLFSVWNEPDKKTFTLQAYKGANNGAKLAGQFYAKLMELPAAIANTRLLAGEFTEEVPTGGAVSLDSLRSNFLTGAGSTPPVWALHPYGDMTNAAANAPFATTNAFSGMAGVSGKPVYLTEVGTRLADAAGSSLAPNGNKGTQWRYGSNLRQRLGSAPTRAFLYHLTAPDKGWDSGFSDQRGRARGSLCGLAGIPEASCEGSPWAYGN